MNFCWCTIMVRDMEESIKFYQDVIELTVNRRFKSGPGTEIAFLGNGETKVELICNENSKEVNYGQDISLGFVVNSIDEMMKLAKEKNLDIHSGPFQPNPHIRFFYLTDPDGLKIQLVENI